ATRGRLVLAYGLEYAILGFATANVATAAGSVAAAYVVANVMRFRFEFEPWTAALAAGAALLLTVTFGLIGTWRAVGEKPARILRNLEAGRHNRAVCGFTEACGLDAGRHNS